MEFHNNTEHRIVIILGEEEFEFTPSKRRVRATRIVVKATYNQFTDRDEIWVSAIHGNVLKKDGTPADLPEYEVRYWTINQDELPTMVERVTEAIEQAKARIRLNLHRDGVQTRLLNKAVQAGVL